MGDDQDDIILIPLTTLQKKVTGQPWLRWIMVPPNPGRAATWHSSRLRLFSTIGTGFAGDPDDFFVRNLADLADVADEAGAS